MYVPYIPHRAVPVVRLGSAARVERRALAMWPRLDRAALHRCHGDPRRIAIQIAHRTKMERGVIEAIIADE
jgi:hypothetical protein